MDGNVLNQALQDSAPLCLVTVCSHGVQAVKEIGGDFREIMTCRIPYLNTDATGRGSITSPPISHVQVQGPEKCCTFLRMHLSVAALLKRTALCI